MARRLLRIVRIVVISLAVAWLAYLVVANVALRTRLGPAFVSSDRVTVTWQSGWSLWPMRFHLRDAELDARGAVRPMRAHASRIDGSLVLRDLLRGRVHVRDGTSAQLDHVRVGTVSYHGDAEMRGSFAVDPTGDVRVNHATVDARSGFVRLDQAPFLENVRGHLVVAASETVDGGLELDAEIASGAFLRPVIRDAADTRGYVRASLRVADGVLAPASTAELRTDPAHSSVVFAVDDAGSAVLTALVHDFMWKTDELGSSPAARAGEIKASVRSPRVRVAAPLEGAAGTVDVRGLEVWARRAPLVGALVSGEPILRGDAHGSIANGVITGRARVGADDVTIVVGDAERRGRLDVDVDLHELRPEAREARLGATANHRWGGGDAALVLEDATVSYDDAAGRGPVLDGDLRVQASNAMFALDALLGPDVLPPAIAFLVRTQAFDARARARLEGNDRVSLRGIEGRAGLVAVRGRYERPARGASPEATLLVDSGLFAVGVSMTKGRTDLVLVDARAWFEQTVAGGPRGS